MPGGEGRGGGTRFLFFPVEVAAVGADEVLRRITDNGTLILEKVKDETEPDAVAIAFDMKAPTFRHKAYAGYKAQRKGMPPELAAQMPVLKELLGDLGECAGGVAVCLGAAIDQKNLHHKLPLLLVTSAEDYRTRGQMAWGAIPATAHHTPRLDR